MKNIKKLYSKESFNYFNIDAVLFLFLMLLCIFGLFVLYSSTNYNLNYIENQFYRMLFGFMIMIFIANIPATYIKMISPYFFIVTVIMLFLVLVLGKEINGSKRWLNLIFFNIQVSELAKISLPLFMAWFIQEYGFVKNIQNLVLSLIFLLIPTILILVEPDLGSALLIFVSGFVIIFASGLPFAFIGYMTGFVLVFSPIAWFYILEDYQKTRILTLFNPESDPLGSGYHIIQSKTAIGAGGWNGQGWLEGMQTHLSYVPEQHTDFIFSVLAEEFGLAGLFLLLFFYGGLVLRTYYIIQKMNLIFYKLVSLSFIAVISFYVFVNIGMVSGILPVVGIPLPFISYGGSALLILFVMFGVISSFANTIKYK